MDAVTKWISVVMIVLIVAYLVAPGSNASGVIKSLGNASAQNVRALAGGVPPAAGGTGAPSTTPVYYS